MATPSQQAINTVLAADAQLTALIASRLYQVEAPQGALMPLLVMHVLTTQPATSHGEGADARLDEVTVTLTALALTPLAAANIIYRVRQVLEASATLKGELMDERQLDRSDDANCHGRAADFRVWNNPDA